MFAPADICTIHEILYNILKIFLAIDVIGIKFFDKLNDFSNKSLFLTIIHFLVWMFSLKIKTFTVKEVCNCYIRLE